MATVIATRSELAERRRRITFAEQGRDLLTEKRATLVAEFHRHRADLLAGLARLADEAAQARALLDDARAHDGPTAVESAALTAADGIPVVLRVRTVAGVGVADLDHGDLVRTPFQRGWARVLIPVRVDAAARAHEELLRDVLDLGAVELSIRRLAGEIAQTTLQINALDNVLLPRLTEESHYIRLTLDEHEREALSRLRQASSRRGSGRERVAS